MSIEEIFASHGEGEFRSGEARVIARILRENDIVLATGGGAFVNAETRELVKSSAISIWLKADFEVLFHRVSRRSNRPLLKTADPRQSLRTLIEARYPIYAEADITVVSREVPQEVVAADVVASVTAYLQTEPHHAG
jgi:shikimate kinase